MRLEWNQGDSLNVSTSLHTHKRYWYARDYNYLDEYICHFFTAKVRVTFLCSRSCLKLFFWSCILIRLRKTKMYHQNISVKERLSIRSLHSKYLVVKTRNYFAIIQVWYENMKYMYLSDDDCNFKTSVVV